MSLRVGTQDGPRERDLELAQRAARLWHARIVETALEMNDAGQFEKAAAYVQRWERRFLRYVVGVPGMEELGITLRTIGQRVRLEWGTAGHKEAYVMARKAMLFEDDARFCPPMSYSDALERDNQA